MQMSDVVNKNHIRHGHMVNITRQIMLEGMRADFRAVDALSQRLVERARQAKRITCRTPAGTDFEAEFSPNLKWLKTSGIITPGEMGQSARRRDFHLAVRTPTASSSLTAWSAIIFARNMATSRRRRSRSKWRTIGFATLQCENKELLEEFRAYTSTDENSNRVGEFAIGTNTACTHVIGNILQDEKIPGIHIAFGHPYAEHTGADWLSKTHIDCVGRDFDIWFDGEQGDGAAESFWCD